MWDLPGPGLKPVSTALAGGFLTTAPPAKPSNVNFKRPSQIITKSLGAGDALLEEALQSIMAVGPRGREGWRQ